MGEAMSTRARKPARPGRGRAVVLALGLALAAGAAWAQTQVYDPKTRSWVDYDRTKAYQYYQKHQQVPEPFRRQVVRFRTAEEPGTIIIDGNQHFLYLRGRGKNP